MSIHRAVRVVILCFLSLLFLGFSPLQAETTPKNCGIPGFVFLPCDARFQPQLSTLPGGIKQLSFRDSQNVALYRSVPYNAMQKEADPLKSLITELRAAFSKQLGRNPKEAWSKSKNGVFFFVMDFGQGHFVTVGAVQAGYLLGSFQFGNLQAPLVIYLQNGEKIPPPPQQIDIAKYPPQYPIASSPPSKTAWRCHSRGHYQVCRKSYGTTWERGCLPRISDSMGFGSIKEIAVAQANMSCSRHMNQMIITGNIGGVASMTRPCQVYRCVRLR